MMRTMEAVLAQCTNILPGHGLRRSMKAIFQTLADALTGDEFLDIYGSGPELAVFETAMAELFGKEAAVFLPTGTMAQQIALRIWCEEQNNFTVAMHPTAHLEYAEQLGYQFLHHIQRLQFGAPEFVSNRLLTVKDFAELSTKPGVILLELPYRPLGGQLPGWEELLAINAWARERGIPLHLDGARIWQCRPFYQREYRAITALFDSVYISFYKDLGSLCGAMLLGSSAFINAARVWQIRHGGRLRTMGPFWLSAQLGLKQVLPQIDQWVARAQAVAVILSRFERIIINPNPPHVNFFQLYIRGDAEQLNDRHLALAEESGTFLFYGLNPTNIPGVAMTEIHCWENALQFRLEELHPFVEKLLS